MRIIYKNSLPTYLSEWHAAMNAKAIAQGRPYSDLTTPQPAKSLSRQEYSICLMLQILEDRLVRAENTLNSPKPDFQAYAEAIVFLDAIYLFMRQLLDSVAGIVRHFHKFNEKEELPKSFDDLLKKACAKELPEKLAAALQKCQRWFPSLKDRRDDIVHHYETYLIGISKNADDKVTFHMFSPRNNSRANVDEDLRSYIGGVLADYQRLTDDILDYWDW